MNINSQTNANSMNLEGGFNPSHPQNFDGNSQESFSYQLAAMIEKSDTEEIEGEAKIRSKFNKRDFPDIYKFNIKFLSGAALDSYFNFNTSKIEQNDAMFFLNILNQGGIIDYTPNSAEVDETSGASLQTSKLLADMIAKSLNTERPLRLDFDNNVTVVMKFDKSGKIVADFIPGDKAVEEYLRQNIPFLKQRFEEQDIPYKKLSYQNFKDGQENKEKSKEKGAK